MPRPIGFAIASFTLTNNAGEWFLSGALTGNGNSMSGDATFPVSLPTGVIQEFNGSWTATRS